jgi:hypothetical protein
MGGVSKHTGFFLEFSVCFFPFGGRENGLWPELVLSLLMHNIFQNS